MISAILFTLSFVCFAAMVTPGKSSKARAPIYTYYVGEDASAPMPTWQRKNAPMGRVAAH